MILRRPRVRPPYRRKRLKESCPMTQTQFSYAGTELDALAEARNYYRTVVSHFAGHVGPRVVEIGAGIGTFAEFLLTDTNVAKLVLVEPADNNVPLLRRRYAGNTRVYVRHGYLEDYVTSLSADSVVAVNVLEHVADDVAFLRA